MKIAIRFLLLFTCIMCAGSALAQYRSPATIDPDSGKVGIFTALTAGPWFTAGVSTINENIPAGWYSKARGAYSFGGEVNFSFSDWLGVSFLALYDARDVFFGSQHDSVTIDYSLGYITLQPMVRILYLMAGISVALPMSGGALQHIAYLPRTNREFDVNTNIDNSDLRPLLELSAGFSIPIYRSESGIVHFVGNVRYPLAKTIKGYASYDSTGGYTGPQNFPIAIPDVYQKSGVGQGPMPTFEAGLSFEFDLLH